MVLTDWMASKIVTNGWAEKIDQRHVPNCVANIRDALKDQPWDPNNDYHYPWQSGMTGVGYNAKTLTRGQHRRADEDRGPVGHPGRKLTFLTEARDTFGLGAAQAGHRPEPARRSPTTTSRRSTTTSSRSSTRACGSPATSTCRTSRQKKIWAAMVWSGDLASSGGEDDGFIVPEEGAMIWTDNMLIPKGAANKYTAELMMNYVYDPKIAAQIANYVYYVSPVKGAAEEIKALDADAATNPLLFPTPRRSSPSSTTSRP